MPTRRVREDKKLPTRSYSSKQEKQIAKTFEGTCTSILESLACGIPVVSTDVGDIHECLRNGYNGCIIKNDETSIIDEAAEVIINILENGIPMDDVYLKYSGDRVVQELKQYIGSL